MKNAIHIGNLTISQSEPPLVIAEIGINHGGSVETAKEMVDAAKRAGAKCVKHQTHVVSDEMTKAAKSVVPGNADISIYEIMASCALSEADEYALMEYVNACGMLFLSTPFSRAAANRLHDFGVKWYKIGSGECNNYPLIEHIAKFGKPMLVSTGMNSLESVKKTRGILEKYRVPHVFLHTTNLYPTPPELVRLGAMTELAQAFPDTLFGLSDHTCSNLACLGATALGASVLERHFTDRMDRIGPDIACSMDESALRELLRQSAEIALMRGGEKRPLKEEQVTMDFAFATVVSIAPIAKGELFSLANIWVKRPGIGVSAQMFGSILGKRAACDIALDTHLTMEMVEANL